MFLAETRENKSNALSATGYGLDFIQLDELNQITNKTGNGAEKFPSIGGYSGHTRVAGFVGTIIMMISIIWKLLFVTMVVICLEV